MVKKDQAEAVGNRKRYRAPALERGLDILELLSRKTRALSQSGIAAELNRSSSEIFRVLGCLVERGYVARNAPGDGFILTMRLRQLAESWPLAKNLLEAALPEMRLLADRAWQSCHLGINNAGRMYVIAQAESPDPVGVTVKVASDYSLLHTASGRVLLTWQSKESADHWIAASEKSISGKRKKEFEQRLDSIRARGYELSDSDIMHGLVDISYPVLDTDGIALAALTVPYMEPLKTRKKIEDVIPMVERSAADISGRMIAGGY